MIQGDGLFRLAEDLGIDPLSIDMIVLGWILRQADGSVISRGEWMGAWNTARIDTLQGMKEEVTKRREQLGIPIRFKDFYEFSFRYSKDPAATVIGSSLLSHCLFIYFYPVVMMVAFSIVFFRSVVDMR